MNKRKSERNNDVEVFIPRKEFRKYESIDISLFYDNFLEDIFFNKESKGFNPIILKMIDCADSIIEDIFFESYSPKNSNKFLDRRCSECLLF